MSRVLTAREVCERALRAIGSFPITESAPDAEQLREALLWLDLIMAEAAGTRTLFHLIPEPVQFQLESGVRKYALRAAMGSRYADGGMQFPIAAWLVPSAGGDGAYLPIVKRETWSRETAAPRSGVPQFIYIDRAPDPTLWVYPTPTDGNFSLQLDYQRHAPDVAPGGISGTTPQGSTVTGYRQAWQRHLIMRLAQDLASGPVIKLPEQSIARFERQAAMALAQLEVFENQEHDNEPPIAAAYGETPPSTGSIASRRHAPGAGAALDPDGYHLILD